jgi:hypothetical protein
MESPLDVLIVKENKRDPQVRRENAERLQWAKANINCEIASCAVCFTHVLGEMHHGRQTPRKVRLPVGWIEWGNEMFCSDECYQEGKRRFTCRRG